MIVLYCSQNNNQHFSDVDGHSLTAICTSTQTTAMSDKAAAWAMKTRPSLTPKSKAGLTSRADMLENDKFCKKTFGLGYKHISVISEACSSKRAKLKRCIAI